MVVVLGLSLETTAQSSSYSNIFIPEKGFVSIFGEHSFVEGGNGISPGMISTARKGLKGFVNFAEGSTWKGASDVQFIDGYVRVFHDNAFVFPVGANGKYRPVSITGAAFTSVAYFDRNPAKVAKQVKNKARKVDNQLLIEQLSEAEYWEVDGKRATNVTFSFGTDSKVGELTEGDLSKLSIVGWKSGQWEIIPSSVDAYAVDNATHSASTGKNLSSLSTGSITTNEAVVPSDYDYFTLAGINADALGGKTEFSMYPNPRLTRMPLNVKYQLPDVDGGTLKIFAANGAILVDRVVAGNHGIITLSDVTNAPGAYTVSITDSKGNTVSKKLIVVAE